MTSRDKMVESLRLLEELTESGYWPFASPAPCSTEVKIKERITAAIANIDDAIYWHDQMFTRQNRDDMKAPSFTIKQIK